MGMRQYMRLCGVSHQEVGLRLDASDGDEDHKDQSLGLREKDVLHHNCCLLYLMYLVYDDVDPI